MANINTLPAISILVIVNYIGKYCSKEKKKLTSYQKLLQLVQLYTNSLYAFNLAVAKFINKLIAKCDQCYEAWYVVPKYTSEWAGMQTDKDYKS